MEYNKKEYTGKGQGNYNTVAASAGLASFLGLDAGNILGGVGRNGEDCHHNHDHYVTEKENDLGIALAVARSEARSEKESKANLEALYAQTIRADDQIKAVNASIADGLIQTGNALGVLTADVKCLQREVDRNREESFRNLQDAKDYTNVRVDATAKQTSCEIEKVYLWTQAQNYVPGEVRVNQRQICQPSPIPVVNVTNECGLN